MRAGTKPNKRRVERFAKFPTVSHGVFAPAVAIATIGLLSVALPSPAKAQWSFTDVSSTAGIDSLHGYICCEFQHEFVHVAGGVAVGDYDGDGWTDLYMVRGDIGPNLLFRNLGNGTFEEVGAAAGVDLQSPEDSGASGPAFADLNGDGWLDLFVGGVFDSPPTLFANDGDGTFTDVTAGSGLDPDYNTYSAAFGDYDRDGDLDMFLAHWHEAIEAYSSSKSLWRNDGNFVFTDVSVSTGVTQAFLDRFGEPIGRDFGFTPNFADINEDGWPDILLAADFGTSMVVLANGDGTFAHATDPSVITDENGMGGSVGDYDNDGHLDWFVSSIWDPDGVVEGGWGMTGNRLYRGLGDGTFVDTTETAGVREGYWGWGSTFADLNNDGHLDLFHVNGWGTASLPLTAEYISDPSRLYVSDGDGTFTESSATLGLVDTHRGRGVGAFDYDQDGDLDLVVSNQSGPLELFRNDGGNNAHWLRVKLNGLAPNTEGIGARVTVTVGATSQVREMQAGSNFESQNPAIAHFGLGTSTTASTVQVLWQAGVTTTLTNVPGDQTITISEPVSTCGDGTVDTGEACDQGLTNGMPTSCCQVNCTLRAAGRVCREGVDSCDPVEVCDGVAPTCPANATSSDGDSDGVCDLLDVCPTVPDPAQSDRDDDGIGDACDQCTRSAALTPTRTRLSLRGLADGASAVRVRYATNWLATGGAAGDLDPISGGVLLALLESNGDSVIHQLLAAPGAWNPTLEFGWRTNSGSTRFKFSDATGLGSVKKATVSVKPDAGKIKLKIQSIEGPYPLGTADLPFLLAVTLTNSALESECVDVVFAAEEPAGICKFSANGNVARCKH